MTECSVVLTRQQHIIPLILIVFVQATGGVTLCWSNVHFRIVPLRHICNTSKGGVLIASLLEGVLTELTVLLPVNALLVSSL